MLHYLVSMTVHIVRAVMMKLTQAILLSLFYFSQAAWANGTLKVKGEILESACAIAPDNAFQTIDLGVISVKNIERDGISKPYPFRFRLINCVLTDSHGNENKSIEVTFTELERANEAMKDSGISIVMKDEYGHRIKSGIPLVDIPIQAGTSVLNYTLYLVGNGRELRAGNYLATMNILINYR